jgi:hypothetical protein
VVTALFLTWRAALTLVTYAGSQIVPLVANGGAGSIGEGREFDYWSSWAQWDGGWFLQIAREGYVDFATAFFPLYPMLIRALSSQLGDEILSGLLISHVAFWAFLCLFHQLVKGRYGGGVALTATVTYLTFPTAFYGVALYSESLLLMLVAASLLFLERERLMAGSVFAGLAAATRLVGAGAFLPVGLYALPRWDWRRQTALRYAMAAVLCLLPLALYCFFLWHKYDDPLQFVEATKSWNRAPADPLTTFLDYFQHPPGTLHFAIELGASLLFVTILVLGVRKIPLAWWLYSAFAVVIPLSSGLLMSIPRYVLASVGAFVIMGIVLHRWPRLKWCVWTASLALQAVLAIRFINGYWVA